MTQYIVLAFSPSNVGRTSIHAITDHQENISDLVFALEAPLKKYLGAWIIYNKTLISRLYEVASSEYYEVQCHSSISSEDIFRTNFGKNIF